MTYGRDRGFTSKCDSNNKPWRPYGTLLLASRLAWNEGSVMANRLAEKESVKAYRCAMDRSVTASRLALERVSFHDLP